MVGNTKIVNHCFGSRGCTLIVNISGGFLAVVPKVDDPTRTLTRTRTLWGDQCLDAVGLVRL